MVKRVWLSSSCRCASKEVTCRTPESPSQIAQRTLLEPGAAEKSMKGEQNPLRNSVSLGNICYLTLAVKVMNIYECSITPVFLHVGSKNCLSVPLGNWTHRHAHIHKGQIQTSNHKLSHWVYPEFQQARETIMDYNECVNIILWFWASLLSELLFYRE